MTPVLDKGHVDLISASVSGQQLVAMIHKFNRGLFEPRFLDVPQLAIEIKCPLFVQLHLSNYNIYLITAKSTNLEAYVPTVDEIGTPLLEDAVAIQASLQQTSEALLLNPKAYQMDKCDSFISQVNAPISVYNTLVGYSKLSSWLMFIKAKGLPKPIEAYRKAVEDIVMAEWADIKPHLKQALK